MISAKKGRKGYEIQGTREDLVKMDVWEELRETKVLAKRLAEVIAFQAEERTSPGALRWECPRCVWATVEQSTQEEEKSQRAGSQRAF